MVEDLGIKIFDSDDEIQYGTPPLQDGNFDVWGDPEATTIRIICTQKVIEATQEHARNDREVGGFLLGRTYRHEGIIYVEVIEYIRAQSQDNSVTHFTFTTDAWAKMWLTREERFEELELIELELVDLIV